ncbi:hypothetical protein [Neorhizobium sp. NCHU2750]|uniref:hypothetical protein n=1 Tax=Neorhizobium sp. NCHU2750 TaxID=1825976 RepID=UPI000E70E23E|nr:hypothetical protein NCHU2750_50700 [Neorhizobium sp. NCHU2750]
MTKPTPEEAIHLRDLFEDIVGAAWFNRNAMTERELLILILERHRDSGGDIEKLKDGCVATARERFSRLR